MIRSSVLLLGLFLITASSKHVDFDDIMTDASKEINQLLDLMTPCLDKTYNCTSKPPWSMPYCCSLGEWLLNNGLWIVTMPLIIGLIVLVVSIISCCCCCNKSRTRR